MATWKPTQASLTRLHSTQMNDKIYKWSGNRNEYIVGWIGLDWIGYRISLHIDLNFIWRHDPSCYHVIRLWFIMSKCCILLVRKTLASGFETLGPGTPGQSGVPSSAFKTQASFVWGRACRFSTVWCCYEEPLSISGGNCLTRNEATETTVASDK